VSPGVASGHLHVPFSKYIIVLVSVSEGVEMVSSVNCCISDRSSEIVRLKQLTKNKINRTKKKFFISKSN
jgi:hypothetical protein